MTLGKLEVEFATLKEKVMHHDRRLERIEARQEGLMTWQWKLAGALGILSAIGAIVGGAVVKVLLG